MRLILAKAIWIVAILAGLAAAFAWVHFIASFGWGPSFPGRGVFMWGLLVPAMLAFFATFFVAWTLLSLLWEAVFREKFPEV